MVSVISYYQFSSYNHCSVGDLVFLHGLGQNILVLNSQTVIMDLLEQRHKIYSDRPRMVVAGELMGFSKVKLRL